MPMMHHSHEEEAERRYDPETLRKVTALAARLQSEHQEHLTASEMEAIGAEVGLEPAFIRKALAQHIEQQSQETHKLQQEQETLALPEEIESLTTQSVWEESAISKREFWAAVAAFTMPIFWGTLAYMNRSSVDVTTFLTLITPAPLTALLGFLAGRRSVGLVAAMSMVLALAPSFPFLFWANSPDSIDTGMRLSAMFAYSLFATPMVATLGALGASLRERYYPIGVESQREQTSVSRPRMLQTLQTMQNQMAGERKHRACLSVDVVGTEELRRSGAQATVEHTFAQYHQWVKEVAHTGEGELHSAIGDSMLFLFPTDAAAVRAARRLQEGVSSFNAALNRLSQPFRLRCGVSGGELDLQAAPTLNHLHTPMFDRAATLQHRAEPGDIVVSSEVAAAALVELEHLGPLAEPIFGATAFSWRAGQRALRSPH